MPSYCVCSIACFNTSPGGPLGQRSHDPTVPGPVLFLCTLSRESCRTYSTNLHNNHSFKCRNIQITKVKCLAFYILHNTLTLWRAKGDIFTMEYYWPWTCLVHRTLQAGGTNVFCVQNSKMAYIISPISKTSSNVISLAYQTELFDQFLLAGL